MTKESTDSERHSRQLLQKFVEQLYGYEWRNSAPDEAILVANINPSEESDEYGFYYEFVHVELDEDLSGKRVIKEYAIEDTYGGAMIYQEFAEENTDW